jgi:hypothetical protein
MSNLNFSQEQIKDIAERFECGMVCYINTKTLKIIYLLDELGMADADMECWQDDLDEIEENYSDYFIIEKMNSTEAFRIMEDFAEIINDKNLKDQLINALNRRKPFQNFKWIIDNSGEYRQKWFDFRSKYYVTWITDQIADYNRWLELRATSKD